MSVLGHHRLESVAGLCPRPAQGAPGGRRPLGHGNRWEHPRAHAAGQGEGVSPGGCDPLPWFGGSTAGATTQQPCPFWVRERERPSPHGPAAETKPRGGLVEDRRRRSRPLAKVGERCHK
jgi:hypothetical protein